MAGFAPAGPARLYVLGGRDIIDLSDLSHSLSIHATGESGLIFHPHRQDFIPLWQSVAYHPMLFARENVDANTEAVLTLEPK